MALDALKYVIEQSDALNLTGLQRIQDNNFAVCDVIEFSRLRSESNTKVEEIRLQLVY